MFSSTSSSSTSDPPVSGMPTSGKHPNDLIKNNDESPPKKPCIRGNEKLPSYIDEGFYMDLKSIYGDEAFVNAIVKEGISTYLVCHYQEFLDNVQEQWQYLADCRPHHAAAWSDLGELICTKDNSLNPLNRIITLLNKVKSRLDEQSDPQTHAALAKSARFLITTQFASLFWVSHAEVFIIGEDSNEAQQRWLNIMGKRLAAKCSCQIIKTLLPEKVSIESCSSSTKQKKPILDIGENFSNLFGLEYWSAFGRPNMVAFRSEQYVTALIVFINACEAHVSRFYHKNGLNLERDVLRGLKKVWVKIFSCCTPKYGIVTGSNKIFDIYEQCINGYYSVISSLLSGTGPIAQSLISLTFELPKSVARFLYLFVKRVGRLPSFSEISISTKVLLECGLDIVKFFNIYNGLVVYWFADLRNDLSLQVQKVKQACSSMRISCLETSYGRKQQEHYFKGVSGVPLIAVENKIKETQLMSFVNQGASILQHLDDDLRYQSNFSEDISPEDLAEDLAWLKVITSCLNKIELSQESCKDLLLFAKVLDFMKSICSVNKLFSLYFLVDMVHVYQIWRCEEMNPIPIDQVGDALRAKFPAAMQKQCIEALLDEDVTSSCFSFFESICTKENFELWLENLRKMESEGKYYWLEYWTKLGNVSDMSYLSTAEGDIWDVESDSSEE